MQGGQKKSSEDSGTRIKGHRERWVVKDKGRYLWVRRDSKGRFLGYGKWSPKEPLEKTLFTETDPLIIEYDTGKEALQKARGVVKEWEWVDFEAES